MEVTQRLCTLQKQALSPSTMQSERADVTELSAAACNIAASMSETLATTGA